jgi:4-hydroxybenzoate polyprenyltransferase
MGILGKKKIDMRINEYLKMLRIGDWIKFYLAAPLAGALLAGAVPAQVILVFIIFFALIGYAFTVNNYFDVEIDRQHTGKMESNKNPLASGSVGRRGVLLMMLFQIGIALVSFGMSYLGFCLVLLNLLLFTAYSGGIRLKERFVLDIITHGLMFGAVPFLTGFALLKGSIPPGILLASSLPFILGAEALIAHQVIEYEEDVLSTRTTVTFIGRRNGLLLLGSAAAVSIVLLMFMAGTKSLPFWAVSVLGWYLLVYPAYSCRSLIRDFRHTTSPQ